MWRLFLYLIALYYTALSVTMWSVPQLWYDLTPGVSMMGPFNSHFIRDAALAYFCAGTVIAWGTFNRNKTATMIGALWPALHGLFHVWIWIGRGVPFDLVAGINLAAIQLPAWLAFYAAHRYFARNW
jgi:hypothetical protein